jgi:hypothetical protein
MAFTSQYVYVGNGDGTVMCIDQKTGSNRYY